MEYNDIYDKNRNLTGRVHRRGSRWKAGEYGLVVCVWVYDGKGNLLLTRRAPGKSFAGTIRLPDADIRAISTISQLAIAGAADDEDELTLLHRQACILHGSLPAAALGL